MALIKKLFSALSRTRNTITDAFAVLTRQRVTPATLEELENQLISADLGIQTVDDIVEVVRKNARSDFISAVRQYLISILPDALPEYHNFMRPTVVMVVGVNGTGKTTTTAKLAHFFRKQDNLVVMVGADTYRAAAVEQIKIWATRLDIRLICNEQSKEPSAVLFDGLTAAKANRADVIIVDTAGRLHTYKNLMAELGKMYRVVENRFPEFDLKSLITIDANLGQNSFVQAKEFANHIKLDGAILTKMDGTAKGGIVFSLNKELNLPVQFIGIGEDLDDLYPFDSKEYVESLFGIEY